MGSRLLENLASRTFTGDLILRETFDDQILSNSKKLWISMQRALLDIHFMILLAELAHLEVPRIR